VLRRKVSVCINYHLPVNNWLCAQCPFFIIIIIIIVVVVVVVIVIFPLGQHLLSMNLFYIIATTNYTKQPLILYADIWNSHATSKYFKENL
jgi:hypothetical protein